MIEPLSPSSYGARVQGLAEVLADAVAGGASVGFRLPFAVEDAAAWWRTREPAVREGTLRVWTATVDGAVAGTVSLSLETKPNGRHRAEVLKLMVHSRFRGRGLGRALLETAEAAAASGGATLLLLDTAAGSPAERLYASAGWTRYGVVPAYATDPSGVLDDCSFFFKKL
ncbi:GNAT family N-acetyltransferase [Dactylosporangium sp. NPDC051485]|uniref:GNAT family N-acetyltransferase n=1 Tax=Dactylosporangium sp. NPDC051485 TaxID=3154846 RepID=UPI00341448F2